MPDASPAAPTPLAESGRLRRDARRFAAALPPVCLGILALILLDAFGPWLVRRPDGGQAVSLLITLIAPGIYLAGLWRLGRALRIFADTGRFVVAAADTLDGVGLALAIGGAFQVLAAPGLETLAGHGPGYWIGIDPAAIALATLGIALLIFARQLRRAARLEAELETIL